MFQHSDSDSRFVVRSGCDEESMKQLVNHFLYRLADL